MQAHLHNYKAARLATDNSRLCAILATIKHHVRRMRLGAVLRYMTSLSSNTLTDTQIALPAPFLSKVVALSGTLRYQTTKTDSNPNTPQSYGYCNAAKMQFGGRGGNDFHNLINNF